MARTKKTVKRMALPRYYIRDDESSDIWCFDARYFSGTKPQ